jgi:hypothetical protein
MNDNKKKNLMNLVLMNDYKKNKFILDLKIIKK